MTSGGTFAAAESVKVRNVSDVADAVLLFGSADVDEFSLAPSFVAPANGVTIAEAQALFAGSGDTGAGEILPAQTSPFEFSTASNSGPATDNYTIVEWTPASDGNYSIYSESDGDPLLAIIEKGTQTVLAADDDYNNASSGNTYDANIETVTLTGGVTYEVVIGQFPGSERVVTQAKIFAENLGTSDVPKLHHTVTTTLMWIFRIV